MGKFIDNENYFRDYGLRQDPFPVDGFDNVLFLTPRIRHRIERIKSLVSGSDKLVLVTALHGAGKSTLADYLETVAEQNWRTSLVQVRDGMDRLTLAHEIIQQISPEWAEDITLSISGLHKFLEYASRNNIVPVFIIDDADRLPVETLTFILELSALRYAESVFRFVLFADEGIVDVLESPALADLHEQLVSALQLPALTRAQLGDYLQNRLSSCGSGEDSPFSDADIDYIHDASGGLPGGINLAARRMLQERLELPAPSPLRRYLPAVAAVMVIAVVAGWYLTRGGDEPVATVARVEMPAPVAPAPTPAPVVSPPEVVVPEAPIDLAEPVLADPAVVETDVSVAMVDEPANDPDVPDTMDSEPASVAAMDETTTTAGTMTEDSVEATTPPDLSEPEPAPAMVTTEDPGIPGEGDDALRAATVTMDEENIFELDSIPGAIRGIRGEAWYRSRPAGEHTLQLISASDINNVLGLLKTVPGIQDRLSGYVRYTPSGKPRYLLYYGNYPDRAAAEAGVADMPEALRRIQPWPRSIASILSDIDAVHAARQ